MRTFVCLLLSLALGAEGILTNYPKIAFFITLPRLIEYILLPYIAIRLSKSVPPSRYICSVALFFFAVNLGVLVEVIFTNSNAIQEPFPDTLGTLLLSNIAVLDFHVVFLVTLFLILSNPKWLLLSLLLQSSSYLFSVFQFLQMDFAWTARGMLGPVPGFISHFFNDRSRVFGLHSYVVILANSMTSALVCLVFLYREKSSSAARALAVYVAAFLVFAGALVTLQRSLWISLAIFLVIVFGTQKKLVLSILLICLIVVGSSWSLFVDIMDFVISSRVKLDDSAENRVLLNIVALIALPLSLVPYSKELYLSFLAPTISDFLSLGDSSAEWVKAYEPHNGLLYFVIRYSFPVTILICALHRNILVKIAKDRFCICCILLYAPNFLTHNSFFFIKDAFASIILACMVAQVLRPPALTANPPVREQETSTSPPPISSSESISIR